ncbi:MAG: co-chaperone GroES [Alphaproteobacteria bacterium]|nr:co-chaperone GroES [Alphaproteobacteria bacterium]
MSTFRPLHDRVLVKRLEAQAQTTSGLFLPETAKEKPQTAEVIAVGPGRTTDKALIPTTVKVGDKVLLGKYAGDEVSLDGVKHVVVKESEILAVIED